MVANKKKTDAKAAKLAAKPIKKTNKKNKNISNETTVDDNFVSEVVSLANPNTKPKPKRKYNKKTNDNNVDNLDVLDNNNNNNNNTTDDPDLDVEIINIDNTNYLVDSDKRIFDFYNHNLIGFIDSNNRLVLN